MTRTGKKSGGAVKAKTDGVTTKRAQASVDAHSTGSGRARKYDRDALMPGILEKIADGKGLRTVLREMVGGPSVGTVLQWVSEDPDLAERYTRARSLCLDSMAEDIIDLADTARIGQKSVSKATGLEITEGDMVERSRLQVEARKWLMARLAPKKYGDKQHVEHSGAIGLEGLIAGADGAD